MNTTTTKNNYFAKFFATLFFALASLLLFHQVREHNSHTDVDSSAYLMNAEKFAQETSFAWLKHVPYYSLGYPLVMGILYKIFGQSKTIIIIFQCLLSLLSMLLLHSLAHRIFNQQVARYTLLFFACNIGYLTFTQFILTEILLAFLLLLFFERFTVFLQTKQTWALFFAALSLGCSIVVKPAGFYFPLLLLPVIFFVSSHKIKSFVVLALAFSVPVISYQMHNKLVFGQAKTGSLQAVNLCYWYFPHILAEKNGTNSDIERRNLQNYAAEHGGDHAVKAYLFRTILDHPFLSVYAWMKNVFKTCTGLYLTNLKVLVDENVFGGKISYFRINGKLFNKVVTYITSGTDFVWLHVVGFFELFYSLLRYCFVAIALVNLLVKKRWSLVYFISSYLFYFSMITGHDGCARFRMLFEFVLILLAALGLWVILNKKGAK